MSLIVIVVLGVLAGFKFHNGLLPVLAGLGLVLAFGYAISWLHCMIGMVAGAERSHKAVRLHSYPIMERTSSTCLASSYAGYSESSISKSLWISLRLGFG